MSKYTFENYKSIFEGAIRKYEGNAFFVSLIQKLHRPVFPSAPGNVAIIAIRHEGKEVGFRENEADDIIALVHVDKAGQRRVYEYKGTTESGFFKKVINPEGDFKMSPGFYFFKRGLHHGKYPCLVQACDVLGERAKKGMAYNETDDKTWQITDGTLHIHAGILNPANVGEWSAGCTVIAGGWQGAAWKQFFEFCKNATNTPIPYVLVNEADVEQFIADGNGSQPAVVEAAPQISMTLEQPAPDASGFETEAEDASPSDVSSVSGVGFKFDRDKFWGQYRQGLARFGERVQQEEVPHVENILDRAERDSRFESLSQLAYMLTTARWETDRFRALFERGGDSYLMQYQGRGGNTRPGDYKRYRGTGYVHLTFRDNFRRAGQLIGAPLEAQPELAADPHWAYEIMVRGHLEGWFTTRKLGEFVNTSKRDFRNARKVINPGELSIADKALATGGRSKRQVQCIEALATQVKWAGMIETCLQGALVAERAASAAAQPGEDVGRELKPEPETSGDAGAASGETGMVLARPDALAESQVGSIPESQLPANVESPVPMKQGDFLQASVGSIKRMNAAIVGGIAAVIAGIKGFVEQNQTLSVIIILVTMGAIIWLVTWYIHVQRDLDKKRMEIASDPEKNRVR